MASFRRLRDLSWEGPRLPTLAVVAVLLAAAVASAGVAELWLIGASFVMAAGIAFAGARRAPDRLPWLLLSGGLTLYAGGWIYYHARLADAPASFPTAADAMWLSLYPAAAVAVALSVGWRRGRHWRALDGLIIGGTLISLGIELVLSVLVAGASAEPIVVLGGALYLSGDLLVLGFLAACYAHPRRIFTRAHAWLTAGFLVFAAADAVYAYRLAHGIHWPGSIVDVMWPLGALLMALAPWQSGGDRRTSPPRDLLFPALAGLVAAVAFAAPNLRPHSLLPAAAVALVVLRLWLTLREMRRTQEALRVSERRHREIVETTTEGVCTLDTAGRTTFVNRRMAEMIGYSDVDLLGRPLVDLSSDPIQPGADPLLERDRSARDFRFLHREGHEVHCLISSSPLRGSDGEHTGMLVMVTDVTDRVLARRAKAELEARLQQAQRLETVGRLAGGIAHDFNNLLAVILNYSDFALDESDPTKIKGEVAEIRAAAERAAALTKQILIFARQDTACSELLSFTQVLAGFQGLLRRTIGEDINIEWRLDPGLWSVESDRSQMEQLTMNLVVNARDAMPDGGAMTITTRNVELDDSGRYPKLAPGRYVALEVTDTGEGMTEDVLQRAFEPFFTTKPPGIGTGLGLATSYGIVCDAGGDIEITSSPGRGTAVTVLMPARDAPEPRGIEAGEVRSETNAVAHILLVEDERAVRRMTARILRGRGHTVTEAAGGSAALAIAAGRDEPFDLLLTDVVMPGMSGPKVAAELTALRPDLAVVFMSGYTDRRDEIPPEARVVAKPFSAATLEHEIQLVLSGRPDRVARATGSQAS